MITVGIIVNSLGWTAFLIPSKIVGGGFSGIGTILYFSLGIPVGVTLAVSNSLLILIAMKLIGAHFGFKTIYGIFLSSGSILFLQTIITEPLVNDAFMATVLGGFLAGAGVGIYFYQGASSGGTDLIALIITKFRDIAPGRILFMLDLVIIGSSYFVFQSMETMIYGFVAMAVAAYSIDMVIEGRKQSAQIFIISEEYDKISERLGKELRRGVTILNGKGWYTNKEKNIV
ncbi:MAG: YitT family protein, partial [Bacteroidota bacterium]